MRLRKIMTAAVLAVGALLGWLTAQLHHYNFCDVAHYEVAGKDALTAGKHVITMDFAYDGKKGEIGKGGTAKLSVDGKEVAKGRIDKTVPIRISLDEGLDVGEDTGTPVNLSYDVPFEFKGKAEKVTVELK